MQGKSKLYIDKNTPNVEKKHPNVDKKWEKKRRPPQGDQAADPPKGETKRPPEHTTRQPKAKKAQPHAKQQKEIRTMKNTAPPRAHRGQGLTGAAPPTAAE